MEVTVDGTAVCRAVPDMRGANIVLPLKAENNGRKKVICAHYDTMYNTVGAYDNCAGAAVVIMLADILAGKQLDRDIDIVLTDAEECRLAGSRRYVQTIDPESIDYCINVDGVGRGDELEIWCGGQSFERRLAEMLGDYPATPWQTIKTPPPPGSGHYPFYLSGIDGVMLTFNVWAYCIHPGMCTNTASWRIWSGWQALY